MTDPTKFILRIEYDHEGFDADGCGDYMYSEFSYKEFKSKDDALKYLRKNIYDADTNRRANFNNIHDYVKEYDFKFYEVIQEQPNELRRP